VIKVIMMRPKYVDIPEVAMAQKPLHNVRWGDAVRL
jgi:hypothetical protein